MDGVKAINKEKQELRNAHTYIKKQQVEHKGLLRSEYDSLKKLLAKPENISANRINILRMINPSDRVSNIETEKLRVDFLEKLDSLSELGDEQQLKMQMIMDRMTKADSAASNMEKKFSEVADSIIQNLK